MESAILAIIGVLSAIFLVGMFAELISVLFDTCKVSVQHTWEASHFKEKGYEKRRRQLREQVALMTAMGGLFLLFGISLINFSLKEENQQYDFATGQGKAGGFLLGGGGLVLLALLCVVRLYVLRVKARALRELSEERKKDTPT